MRDIQIIYKETLEILLDKFPNKEGMEDKIIITLLSRHLTEIKLDLSKLTFQEFFIKYKLRGEFLNREDLTKSTTENIINEAKMSKRDTTIAKLKFLNNYNEEAIADELQIEKKTVHNNLDKISKQLRKTAYQYFNNYK